MMLFAKVGWLLVFIAASGTDTWGCVGSFYIYYKGRKRFFQDLDYFFQKNFKTLLTNHCVGVIIVKRFALQHSLGVRYV